MALNLGSANGSTKIGNTDVPDQYVELVQTSATALGIPPGIVAAQIDYESGFDPNALSPAGAEGIAQFLPSTYNGLGIGGSPYQVPDAFRAYVLYMGQLLKQENGNVFNALAAYNAGPGNLGAGDGYAQHIFSVAGYLRGLLQGATGALPNAPNGATEGGQGAAGTVTTQGSWTSALGDAYNDVTSGLMIWPASFLAAVGDVDKVVAALYSHAALFFKPSTYVRIGAGVAGAGCLVTALVLMIKEANA